MTLDTIPIRIRNADFHKVCKYQEWRQLPTKAMALAQIIRTTDLVMQYTIASNDDRKSGRWYKPSENYTEKTIIDEMNPKERELFMRGFFHSVGNKLDFDEQKQKSEKKDSGPGLDDAL